MKEYYVDKVSDISVEGQIISIDFGRFTSSNDNKRQLTKKVSITLSGANFLNLVKTLNESVKAISERTKAQASTIIKDSKDTQAEIKNK